MKMMMKLLHAGGHCYKHSLGFPLMQPLPPSVCNLQTLHGFSKLGFALQGVCSFSSANPPCCTEWSGYSQLYQLKIEKTAVRNGWGVKSLCVKLLPHAVTPSAPIQASLHGPATVTLSMTIISPSCRMGCKCRRSSGAGAECPGSLLWNPKCGVLLPRWALPCPVTRCHLTGTHTWRTGTVLISTGTLTWSQVLPAVLGESFCEERKSPPPVGDSNSAFMVGSQRRWRNLVRLTKNSEGRSWFRVKPGMPGSSACLLWGAFKVPVFKWTRVIFNGKRNFFKMLQYGAKKNLISDLYRKISNTALPTSHFSFPTRKMGKEARERGKMRWLFFQTKENFESLKVFEHK